MKKLMIAFLAGSILIGVGLGVTALEVSEWDVTERPFYLENEKLETGSTEEEIDIKDFSQVKFYVSQSANSFRSPKQFITVIEDETCDETFKIEVDYRGEEPESDIYINSWEDENGQEVTALQYRLYPHYNQSLRYARQIIEEMFEKKIFYTENVTTLIEKVRIYTAYPELFDIEY